MLSSFNKPLKYKILGSCATIVLSMIANIMKVTVSVNSVGIFPRQVNLCCSPPPPRLGKFDMKRSEMLVFLLGIKSRILVSLGMLMTKQMPVGRGGGLNSVGVKGRALHNSHPRAFCTLPCFARIKRPRWRPLELNDGHLRSHGKIGDCGQSTILAVKVSFRVQSKN